MKPRVYIETSVLSYLTALPSRDLVRAAHQQITMEWWSQRERFDLFASEVVLAAAIRPRIETVCRESGFQPLVICTPEELLAQEES